MVIIAGFIIVLIVKKLVIINKIKDKSANKKLFIAS